MVVALAPFDEEVAAIEDHPCLAARQPGAGSADEGGASARAAGFGKAGGPLPHAQADGFPVNHLGKADIRALRKQRVPLHQRADGGDVIGVYVLDEEHGMGIAHRDNRRARQNRRVNRADFYIDPAHIHLFREGNIFPAHLGRAHVHRDQAAFGAIGAQHVRLGLDRHPVLAGLVQHQEADAAGSIAAGGNFRAVGIPDAHEHILRGIALHRDHLIGFQVTGNLADLLNSRREGRGAGIKNGKGIAGAVHLPELHG